MKAKVTKEFEGRPDGEALARTIKVDEIIGGDLAEVAVREKWAEEIEGSEPAKPAVDPTANLNTVTKLKDFARRRRIDLGGAKTEDAIRAVIVAAIEKK